jgi:putative mRNA 3-end processing factor
MSTDLLVPAPEGLFCAAGGFHVDPWGAAATAVITHVHGDHLRPGSQKYVCAAPSLPFLRRRLGPDVMAEGVPYGERFRLGEAKLSFHPSGHVLGAAQVRIETGGEVWIVSGDYKRAPDPTCAPFEVVPADVFITEATFALPLYRWHEPGAVVREMLAWWDANRAAGIASVLFAYAMGKAPRILAELDAWIRRHTTEKYGPTRAVEPVQVFELAFEGIAPSSRHRSGVAVRFPRIQRWRKDKPAAEADTIEALRAFLPVRDGPGGD